MIANEDKHGDLSLQIASELAALLAGHLRDGMGACAFLERLRVPEAARLERMARDSKDLARDYLLKLTNAGRSSRLD